MTRLASRTTLMAPAIATILFSVLSIAARCQNPGLVAEHFPLPLTQTQALARADEAVRAAGLVVYPPTSISRGGHNGYLTVLIHCIENDKATLVDLEVADIGHPKECLAMRAFLTAFMKTGAQPTAKDFTGEWETNSSGTRYTMRLVQSGDRVTGTYEPLGGTIQGTVVGNVLRLQWTQKSGTKGVGRFTLSPDGSSFTGLWGYGDDPDKVNQSWDGKRTGVSITPTGPSFAGEWDTRSAGGPSFRMKLTQVGSKVTGKYTNGSTEGSLEGTVSGGVLRFKWTQSNGNKGSGRFTLLPDGSAFAGAWTYEDDPEKADKYWDGKRVGTAPANSLTSSNDSKSPATEQPVRPVGGVKELVALGPTLSPPGYEDKRPIYALPKINLTSAPLPLPPVGVHRTIPDKPGSEVKAPEPLKIVRIRLTHTPDIARGMLNAEAELSRKPLPGECSVEFYVGGYLDIDYKNLRFYDAYEFARAAEPASPDLRYSQQFTIPSVLPARVRAELISPATGRVIDHAEELFTHPFPDVSLDHVMLYGDEMERTVTSGIGFVSGSVPQGLLLRFSISVPNKSQAEMGLSGKTYRASVVAISQDVKVTSGAALSPLYGDKPPEILNFIRWTEKDADPSAPGIANNLAQYSIEMRSATQNGWALDERKTFGFGGPNRGYDPTQLKRRTR